MTTSYPHRTTNALGQLIKYEIGDVAVEYSYYSTGELKKIKHLRGTDTKLEVFYKNRALMYCLKNNGDEFFYLEDGTECGPDDKGNKLSYTTNNELRWEITIHD
ncbi:MAG: hypothetical protein WCI80_05530 [Bacteroidota bacterium]